MKLINRTKIEETVCPSGGFCRGETCSAFNWFDKWEYKYVSFKIPSQWWHYFRPFKYNKVYTEAFVQWEPEEIEGWKYIGKEVPWWDDTDEHYSAEYRRLKENGRWFCGLNVENS